MKTDSKQIVLRVLNEASNAEHFFDLSDAERLAWMVERAFVLGTQCIKQRPRGRGRRRPRLKRKR